MKRKGRSWAVAACALAGLVGLLYIGMPYLLEQMDDAVIPAMRIEEEQTMETSYMLLQEGRIAYDDTGGSGPLILCVPGLGDLRQEYRFIAPALQAAGYRVVTMDLRGHGASSTGWPSYTTSAVGSDILALIEHLGAGPAFVAGTSMASGAAVWAAAERPELLAGQILIGPFVLDTPVSLSDKLMLKAALARPWGVSAWSLYYKSLYPTSPPADLNEYRGKLKQNLREPGRFTAVNAMIWRPKEDIAERLDRISIPTLVVMGTKDPDFKNPGPEETARAIADRVQGELTLVEGAGHYPHAEMPVETSAAVLAFLGKHAG